MPSLWQKWTAMSYRISTILVVLCGSISIIGGWELYSVGGPRWIAVVFAVFGLGLLGVVILSGLRKST